MWQSYEMPTSVEEAITILARFDGRAQLIAGGTDLLVLIKKRRVSPQCVIDIKNIPGLDYIEYEKGWNLFLQAQDAKDNNLYRQAAEMFKTVYEQYPGTESEIGALTNAGICYEALNMWLEAIEVYDRVLLMYEEGEGVTLDAFNFARIHRAYIEANRL